MKDNYKKLKKILAFVIILLLLELACSNTNVSFHLLMKRGNRFFEFLFKMFPPDSTFLPSVLEPMFATIRMSIAGTAIGAFLGIFTAFLSSRNLIRNRLLTGLIRILVQCIRTIPVLILALISTFVFGIGTFAGTTALMLYTWAVMTRIGSEDIEGMTLKSYEAIVHSGCGKMKAFVRTVLIQMLPGYLNNALYLLETNVRHASILGYVGAGGIGLLLNEKISWREYRKVGMILIMLYLVVILIELVGQVLRNYLTGGIKHTRFKNVTLFSSVILVLAASIATIGKPNMTALGLRVVGSIMSGIIHPDWSYLWSFASDGVLHLILETVCIAFVGTFFGALLAIVLSFLNSTKLLPEIIAVPFRLFIMAIRTVPVFIYGLMFIRVTGPGSFAGVLTLSLCSIGLLSKRFTVAIDQLDLHVWNAYKSMGISWIKRVKYCIFIPLWPQLVIASFYRFDVNIRSASVLGLVGAGGIGAPLIMYMNNYRWDAVGAILIGLFLIVLLLEYLSGVIRKRQFAR